MNPAMLTLLTDFGLNDEYVGIMKGVIARCNPTVQVVDICHRIPPFDVAGAAYMLEAAYRHFPIGTTHVAVVDPGVGSDRDLLGACYDGHYFIAPDNGLLSFLTELRNVELVRLDYAAPDQATFYGRDVMAPLAVKLATGTLLTALGAPITAESMQKLPHFRSEAGVDGILRGRIVWRDNFGNLVTNIRQTDLEQFLGTLSGLRIFLEDRAFEFAHYYNQKETGAGLALINSRGYLELALNGADLSQTLFYQNAAVMVFK